MEKRFKERIKKAIFSKPYWRYFILWFFLFLAFNILVNQSLEIYLNPSSLRLWFAILFFGLNITVSFLVALNVNLVIIRYKEVGGVSAKGGAFGSLGVLGGVLGGSCAACFAGLFPAVMGVLGVAFNYNELPLHGLEMEIIAVILLLISVRMFIRDPVCKIRLK